MTAVDRVCSPPMVATAKGSGNPISRSTLLKSTFRAWNLTEDISSMQSISGYDCGPSASKAMGMKGEHSTSNSKIRFSVLRG